MARLQGWPGLLYLERATKSWQSKDGSPWPDSRVGPGYYTWKEPLNPGSPRMTAHGQAPGLANVPPIILEIRIFS